MEVLPVNFIECSISFGEKLIQAKKPEEVILQIERGRVCPMPRQSRAIGFEQLQFGALNGSTWGFLFDLFSRSLQSFLNVVTLLLYVNVTFFSVVRFKGISILIILGTSLPLRAQTVADYAGEFLELGVGAR
ncbi:MAG: hypothetical protein ACHQNE_10230, partial [Candidatus Kapaibacterium sp.]